MNVDLLEAVKERIQLGYSDDKIKEELVAAGYEESIIPEVVDAARREISDNLSKPTSNIPEAKTIADASTLVSDAFKFAWARYDLVLLLAIPFLALTVINYVALQFSVDAMTIDLVTGVLALVALLVYLYVLISILFIVVNDAQWDVTFNEGFAWAKKNVGKFIYINILSSLAVMGGLFLLVIPGLIVSIYLSLTKVVLVKESRSGFDNLLRSRELIKGYWWPVLWRFTVLGLSFLALVLAAGIVTGLVSAVLNLSIHSSEFELISALFTNIIGGATTLMGLYLSVRIYEQLSAKQPTYSEETTKGKWKYTTMALIGLLWVPFIIASVYFGETLEQEIMEETFSDERLETKERATELREGVITE